jgi:hypothetical protein
LPIANYSHKLTFSLAGESLDWAGFAALPENVPGEICLPVRSELDGDPSRENQRGVKPFISTYANVMI